MNKIIFTFFIILLGVFIVSANTTSANHSWGGYHWARTTNPLVLKLGNNLTTPWQAFLQTASADWSVSSVLDTAIVAGNANPKNCKPTAGQIAVCNSKYGNNGWLGIAQIWISGSHITQGVTKLNDSYFNTAKYNTPAWKQFVVCQEVGHIFGLNHQDENFNNINLGSCMDYTSDPTGTLGTNGTEGNTHPNAHDYEQLLSIYTHLDTINTSANSVANTNSAADLSDPSAWGRSVRESGDKKTSVFERDFGKGNKVITFVIWAQ